MEPTYNKVRDFNVKFDAAVKSAPSQIMGKFSGHSVCAKVAIGVTSPLWFTAGVVALVAGGIFGGLARAISGGLERGLKSKAKVIKDTANEPASPPQLARSAEKTSIVVVEDKFVPNDSTVIDTLRHPSESAEGPPQEGSKTDLTKPEEMAASTAEKVPEKAKPAELEIPSEDQIKNMKFPEIREKFKELHENFLELRKQTASAFLPDAGSSADPDAIRNSPAFKFLVNVALASSDDEVVEFAAKILGSDDPEKQAHASISEFVATTKTTLETQAAKSEIPTVDALKKMTLDQIKEKYEQIFAPIRENPDNPDPKELSDNRQFLGNVMALFRYYDTGLEFQKISRWAVDAFLDFYLNYEKFENILEGNLPTEKLQLVKDQLSQKKELPKEVIELLESQNSIYQYIRQSMPASDRDISRLWNIVESRLGSSEQNHEPK